MTNCNKCKDSKVIYSKEGIPIKCTCLYVEEIKNYLTPLYLDALYTEQENILPILSTAEKINLIFNSVSWEKIRMIVKSYLLYTKRKYSHITTTPTEIIRNHINNPEIYDSYKSVNLLIIKFGSDVFNSHYQYIIPNLLEHRKIYPNRKTWVATTMDPEKQQFVDHYGRPVVDFIVDKKYFKEVK